MARHFDAVNITANEAFAEQDNTFNIERRTNISVFTHKYRKSGNMSRGACKLRPI